MKDNDYSELILRICDDIKENLQSDLISYGELIETIKTFLPAIALAPMLIDRVILNLLLSGIEIGWARKTDYHHVKFIAWKGNITQRMEKMHNEISTSSAEDRAFTFWLCLPANVDEYEV